MDLLSQSPHRRLNPLTGEYVLVSPHRLQRPWQGKTEATATARPAYDPTCYLCPGNARAGGVKNPDYTGVFVFENDFAALTRDPAPGGLNEAGLLVAEPESGICRVVCFSPRHDLTLAEMPVADIRAVVEMWEQQSRELGGRDDIGYVQIFENKGAIMGCSNPHPHGQIWATSTVPSEVAREDAHQRDYLVRHGRALLCDYLAIETRLRERIVCESEHWVALVPFWAKWPFEGMILPRRAVGTLSDLGDAERHDLAAIMKAVLCRYDNLFLTSFPYTMGIHQAPPKGGPHPHWQLHLHYYPPLLRSATVQKFMVGFEMLGMAQRDITPEHAAERLRSLPERHFTEVAP